jgi:hypothetical protein
VLIGEIKHKEKMGGGMSTKMYSKIRHSKHKIKAKKEHEKGRK